MRAVILAGGVGSRLDSLSEGRPKALVDIGGRPLVMHQLEALADHGVGPVLMIVGYKHEMIRDVVGQRVEYLLNERYQETNSLYSLWLGRDWIGRGGPFVLLNSDLFFDPEILSRVLEEPGNVLAYDSTSSHGREQTKVAIRERRVTDLGKDLPAHSARGESLGLLKFDDEGTKAMLGVADHLIGDGHERAWVIEATRAVCRSVPVYGVNVAGLPWAEVDFPYDLEHARREVWPAIRRGRWGRGLRWKRTRWLAGAGLAVTLAAGGWFASTRVGPASLDWENVAPLSGSQQQLLFPSGSQRWWLVQVGDSLTALVEGGTPVRVETRLLMPPGTLSPASYVIAVSVDGRTVDWDAFRATPDTTAVMPGAVVGDRDRVEISVPAGQHAVGVSLVAGHAERLLVRIRRPE